MLPLVLQSGIFWILLGIHGIELLLHRLQVDGERLVDFPTMSFPAVGIVTGLLTFFLVFYGSQSYGRFNTFYGHCVGLGGSCMNWVALVKLHFPDNPNTQWNAVRLILAAMHVRDSPQHRARGPPAVRTSTRGT
jgi:hypothetical protein